MARTYVLGLGNVLMGDDGFGPAVIREFLERYSVGPEVEVIDIGTPGLDLTPWLTDTHHVIFVDTVKAKAEPGTLRIYCPSGDQSLTYTRLLEFQTCRGESPSIPMVSNRVVVES